jgi:hypothetical protein
VLLGGTRGRLGVTPLRLLAIGFIFVCTAFCWATLGASLVARTGEKDQHLTEAVERLWGGRHTQVGPDAYLEVERSIQEDVEQKNEKTGQIVVRKVAKTVTDRIGVPLDQSRVEVSLNLDQRRKGLLWYSTYGLELAGRYRLHNPDAVPRTVFVHFAFPSQEALYDSFSFRVNGQDAGPVTDLAHGVLARVDLSGGSKASVEIRYRSRGLGDWTYAFGGAQVRDFSLEMSTDFAAIDFPPGSLSPSRKTQEGGGWKLAWTFESLVTGETIAVTPPARLNPGPLAARITFFAPVSLLFFLAVLVILGAVRGQVLHPMNYFFLSAAFFAFHLLLAYLVDHLDIHLSFLIASLVSVFLVVSYLRLVGGIRYALLEAGTAQCIFLVLFSYAFFFEGFTGLTVAVGAVLTLFVLMQATARVNWGAAFERGNQKG